VDGRHKAGHDGFGKPINRYRYKSPIVARRRKTGGAPFPGGTCRLGRVRRRPRGSCPGLEALITRSLTDCPLYETGLVVEIRQTDVFAAWFAGLRDRKARPGSLLESAVYRSTIRAM